LFSASFSFLYIGQKEKLAENKEISRFRLFLAPGIDFLGKNTWEIVYLKKIRANFFRPFFGEIEYFSLFSPNISKILAPESGRKLKFFGDHSNNYLAFCPECQPFIKSDVFLGHPVVLKWHPKVC